MLRPHLLPPSLRVVVVALALIAASCGSDSGTDSSGGDASDDPVTDSTAEPFAATDDDAATPGAGAPDGDTATPDPLVVAQLGQLLAGGALTDDANACLVSASEDGGLFAQAVNVAVGGQRTLTDEEFAAIALNVRDCAGTDPMVGAITAALSPNTGAPGLEECLREAGQDDGALVGLAALTVGLPVGADDQLATLDALVACVPDEIVADQLAAQYEASVGFAVAVDRECVTDSLAATDLSVFWDATVLNDTTGFDSVVSAVEACGEDPWADLADAVPDDFVPWSGTGALAEVRPPARNAAYTAPPPMTIDPDASYEAVITTDDGEIVIELFAELAPLTVNNFVNLARDGFYDGTVFHRVLADFMAQAGDPTGTGTGGPGYQFEDEVDTGLEFDRRGLLAMANSGPATNGSQFFITLLPTPHLNGLHTIFGEVVDGDVVLGSIDLRDPQQPTGRGEIVRSIEIIETSA